MGRFRERAYLLVKAPAGARVPHPYRHGVDIAEQPIELPNTIVVRRMLGDGSLDLVPDAAPVRKTKTTRESGRK